MSGSRKFPEYVSSDAVVAYLGELHKQLDTLAFSVRSTLVAVTSGGLNPQGTEVPQSSPEVSVGDEASPRKDTQSL